MSYVRRTRHPIRRRHQYIEKRNAARRAYLKANPEEQNKVYTHWGITIGGSTIAALCLVGGAGGLALLFFIVTVVLGIVFGPNYQE
ncbi:MAG: hypothetical protein R2864_08840 [Syntrophotaleaceae bacterium]